MNILPNLILTTGQLGNSLCSHLIILYLFKIIIPISKLGLFGIEQKRDLEEKEVENENQFRQGKKKPVGLNYPSAHKK